MAGNVIRGAQGTKQVFSVKSPLGGMKPDVSPASQSEKDFAYLQNVRRVGGDVVSRGGQSAFATLTGEATGMVDFQTSGDGDGGGGIKLFVILGGGAGPTYQYSSNNSPVLQARVTPEMLDYDVVNAFGYVARCNLDATRPGLNGYVLTIRAISNTQSVYMVGPIAAPYGVSQQSIGGSPPTPLFQIPGAWSPTPYLITVGANLYIGLSDAVEPTSRIVIYRWDGVTLTKEYDQNITNNAGASAYFGGAAVFRGAPVFGLHCQITTGPNVLSGKLLYRSSAGVWNVYNSPTFALVGGLASSMSRWPFVSYRNKLYSVDQGSFDLFSFDGTTVTRLPPATTGIDNAPPVFGVDFSRGSGLAVFDGYLYYSWVLRNNSDGSGDQSRLHKARIGRYDGTTWTATIKDLQLQFAPYGDLTMIGFEGQLIVASNDGGQATPGAPPAFYKSPGRNVAGTWALENIGVANSTFVDQLLAI